jgi:transmembrane sensor
MKEKMNSDKFTDSDWEEIASSLSGEKEGGSELVDQFLGSDDAGTVKNWKALRDKKDEREIDADKAWRKVNSRLNESGGVSVKSNYRIIPTRSTFMRVAAVGLILVSLGTAALYLGKSDTLRNKIVIATNDDQKNFRVDLPDGSYIYMNRNSELRYRANFGKRNRNVALSGEAFFEIAPDASKPFIIDAGKASIKVVGTSFNIITSNIDSAVEVYVKTGKVMLSDNTLNKNILLEPGDVGTMETGVSVKTVNNDPNYMSWNTGLLVYNGQKLDIVFKDLKRVYNMDIVADDPDILEKTWTSPIDNQPQETIIRLICASFNFSYVKEGEIYRLIKE